MSQRNEREAFFHSNWEVLMGQGEVQNWIRSRPDQEARFGAVVQLSE